MYPDGARTTLHTRLCTAEQAEFEGLTLSGFNMYLQLLQFFTFSKIAQHLAGM